jgi:hypothetical protein
MKQAAVEDYFRVSDGIPHAGGICDPDSVGYVYVVGFDEPNIVKIGSATCPTSRLSELQVGNPFELQLKALVSIYEGNPTSVEFAAHRLAAEFRIRGEWFELDAGDAVLCILKAARMRKAKFGPYAFAFDQHASQEAHARRIEKMEQERLRALRVKLGIDETAA